MKWESENFKLSEMTIKERVALEKIKLLIETAIEILEINQK